MLAIASKGDVAVLAAALAIAAGTWPSTVGVVLGLATASARVGATSLRAISGAQSVLGPAGWNGSSTAVAATWLAAAAVISAARPLDTCDSRWAAVPVAVAFGSSSAVVAAGPGPGGALAVRLVATVLASVAVGAVVAVRGRPSADRALGFASVVLGALAIAFGVAGR